MTNAGPTIDGGLSDVRRWNILSRRVSEKRIASAFTRLSNIAIKPILIKGWAAARWYPDSVAREYVDIDLAVSKSDYSAVSKLSLSEPNILDGVDLHRELRHLDTMEWETLFSRSQMINLDNTPVRILAPEDHLRVMAVHWLNDGGANKDRLWDIYYAISNRPPDFDWEKCLGVVSPKRRRWVICTIGLAHKYLDLYIDDLPFASEAKQLPEWLTDTVESEWTSEVFLRPLQTCLKDPGEFFRQIKKRFPPNPIQATIDVEGEFDSGGRAIYQIKDIAQRTGPSLKRIASALFRR